MIIIDTNVVSEAMRVAPSRAVLNWLNDRDPALLFVTAVSIAEISFGINVLPEGRRRRNLAVNFDRFIDSGFHSRVLSFDDAAAWIYGEVMGYRRSIGRPMSVPDGQIASIARLNKFALATRNIKDFEDCGLSLIDPFESQD